MSIYTIAPFVGLFSLLGMLVLVWRRWPSEAEWEANGVSEPKEGSEKKNRLVGVVEWVRSLPWEHYEERALARTERMLVFLRRQILKLDARTSSWIEKIRKHRNHTLNGNHTAPIWEEMKEAKTL